MLIVVEDGDVTYWTEIELKYSNFEKAKAKETEK